MTSSNKKQLRIGMLGFGSMGKTHLYSIQNLPFFYGSLPFDASVYGVCTTSMEKSEAVAAQFGIPFATASQDELILHPEINVIDICTPNVLHYDALKRRSLRASTCFAKSRFASIPVRQAKSPLCHFKTDRSAAWYLTTVGSPPICVQSSSSRKESLARS